MAVERVKAMYICMNLVKEQAHRHLWKSVFAEVV